MSTYRTSHIISKPRFGKTFQRKTGKFIAGCLCLFTLSIFLLTGNRAQAQGDEFIFNHLTARDGLASNFVYCLWQDPKGYLWIGTENGLQRYDGYQFFSPYQGNGKDRLPRLPIHQILNDTLGRMWVRMGKTIGIFDKESFRYKDVPLAKGTEISEMADLILQKDAEGKVFLVARNTGWFYYDESSNTFREDIAPVKIPRSFGIFTTFDDAQSGRFWIGGKGGLLCFDRKKKQLYRNGDATAPHLLLQDPKLGHPVTNIYIDSKRRHWLTCWDTTGYGVRYFCYDEATNQYSDDTTGLSTVSPGGYFELNHFTEFADTIVLAYGLHYMCMREGDRFGTFIYPGPPAYTIEFTKVYSVIQDREKILWVATDNGLYNSMSRITTGLHLVLRQDIKRGNINSVLELNDGTLWLGTWGRGVLPLATFKKKSSVTYFKEPHKDSNYMLVWDMLQHTGDGRVWISCQAGRLMIYDTTKKSAAHLVPAPFKQSTIRQVAEDKQGNIWFGTQSGKIFRWNKGSSLQDSSFKLVREFGSIIARMYFDNRGLLWVATGGKGVTVIDPADGRELRHYNSTETNGKLYGNHVRDVVQINDSIYAIANDGLDLINYNTGKVSRAPNYNQWPVGPVLTVQVDDQKNLWVCTASGVFKYNSEGGYFIRFTQWDGLITIYNNTYLMETSTRLRDGRIIFGGNQNMVLFNPSEYRDKNLPPDVMIGSCKLFNEFLSVDSLMKEGGLTLPYNRNSVSLTFAALSFARIDKLSYYYMLEGANKDWIRMDGPLQVNYTLLPPGKYTFKVRAKNEQGVFSPNTTSLKITILPPFWRTYWFYALVALSIAGALYYLYRLRIRRLLQVEKIRTRLARDLHDDMGSTLSTINILSNMAVKKIDSDQKASQDYMGRISDSSSRIMEAMDDIVWSINPVNDSMRKILARMKEFAGNVLEASDIDYTFTVDDAVKDMTFDMEWRREIFLVFKEAINNIVKYSKASRVDITLRKHRAGLQMTVTDNGVGFDQDKDPQLAVRGNGLKNMRKRAEAMNGSLQIISAPESGTSVELRIPLA